MKDPNHEQLKRLIYEFDGTPEPEPSNHNYRVPFSLNDHLNTLRTSYEDVVENKNTESEFYEVFRRLENIKGHRFQLAFEYLIEKYSNASNIKHFTKEHNHNKKSGFILYLRGFYTSTKYFKSGSQQFNSGVSDTSSILKISSILKNIPLFFIGDPNESVTTICTTNFDYKHNQIFRIDSDVNWELPTIETAILLLTVFTSYCPAQT